MDNKTHVDPANQSGRPNLVLPSQDLAANNKPGETANGCSDGQVETVVTAA